MKISYNLVYGGLLAA